MSIVLFVDTTNDSVCQLKTFHTRNERLVCVFRTYEFTIVSFLKKRNISLWHPSLCKYVCMDEFNNRCIPLPFGPMIGRLSSPINSDNLSTYKIPQASTSVFDGETGTHACMITLWSGVLMEVVESMLWEIGYAGWSKYYVREGEVRVVRHR